MADAPGWYKIAGIALALSSGAFIGSSFIFQKMGLNESQRLKEELEQRRSREGSISNDLESAVGGKAGGGHAYLKSGVWWLGMLLMAVGEVANFGAYAFVPAILVTPLGALSVVIRQVFDSSLDVPVANQVQSAILSSIFLKEHLSFSGKIGCGQCLIGAVIIVLHAPSSNSTQTIPEFFSYVISPGFLCYAILALGFILGMIYYVAPRYGDKNPLVYISICSTVGSFLVLSTQGFGSSVVYTASQWPHDNQFLQWPIYPLMAFIVFTIIIQINFLNKALAEFSTSIVTPVYYVFFTTMTMVSSAVLFRGFSVDSIISGASIIAGFLIIIGGVALLFQYNIKAMKLLELKRQRSEASLKLSMQLEEEAAMAAAGIFNGEDGAAGDGERKFHVRERLKGEEAEDCSDSDGARGGAARSDDADSVDASSPRLQSTVSDNDQRSSKTKQSRSKKQKEREVDEIVAEDDYGKFLSSSHSSGSSTFILPLQSDAHHSTTTQRYSIPNPFASRKASAEADPSSPPTSSSKIPEYPPTATSSSSSPGPRRYSRGGRGSDASSNAPSPGPTFATLLRAAVSPSPSNNSISSAAPLLRSAPQPPQTRSMSAPVQQHPSTAETDFNVPLALPISVRRGSTRGEEEGGAKRNSIGMTLAAPQTDNGFNTCTYNTSKVLYRLPSFVSPHGTRPGQPHCRVGEFTVTTPLMPERVPREDDAKPSSHVANGVGTILK
ncbi:hypothetical protein HK101_003388 [Irineochytrium annulatum]|nr:hypothetical protein HK101_003388 [Irineochytrium annulatum]